MDMRIHAAGTAHVLLAIRADGRLALSRAATEALHRAEAILEGDRVLGAVCSADLHDAIVPQMAENAFAIGLAVRAMERDGLVEILADEEPFFSSVAADMSLGGFALVASA